MIIAIRVFFFYLFWAVAVVIFFPLMVAGLPSSVYCRGCIMSRCAAIVFWGLKHILGIDCRLRGADNLPPAPYVILSKHQSFLETIAFNRLFYPTCFVLKKELISIPLFGWGLAMAGSIAIDRLSGSRAMTKIVEVGKRRLSEGFNLVIFPEGTRVPPGEKRRYHRGGALLACHLNVQIVPVALNTGEFAPKGLTIRKMGTATISIGPTIDPTGKRPSDVTREVEAWIENEMRVISDPAFYPAETDNSTVVAETP